ncbi:MAG: GNAT family N-acetyltransferase [Cyanobacteria bacterium J06639_14]
MLKIIKPESHEDLQQTRTLICESVDWLRHHYPDHLPVINEYFEGQAFQQELDNLLGYYAPPEGCLLLAIKDERAAGCIALRKLTTAICEMKRLFVRTEFQRQGIGLALAKTIIQEAKAIGYPQMRLDTGMQQIGAQRLYQKLGFKPIKPYYALSETLRNGLVFMELDLS